MRPKHLLHADRYASSRIAWCAAISSSSDCLGPEGRSARTRIYKKCRAHEFGTYWTRPVSLEAQCMSVRGYFRQHASLRRVLSRTLVGSSRSLVAESITRTQAPRVLKRKLHGFELPLARTTQNKPSPYVNS